MKIDVRITSTCNNYGDLTRALATVVRGDSFAIKGVRVVKGENGLFCSMPARRLKSGGYSKACHPITSDFALKMNAPMLEQFTTLRTRAVIRQSRVAEIDYEITEL